MRKWRIAVAIIALLLAVAAFGAWSWFRNLTEFDSARWKSAVNSDQCAGARGWMVRDLRKHHIRVGMRRERVIALLGPPDSDRSADNLEWAAGGGFDCRYFVVRFDGFGRVFEVDPERY